MQLLDLPVTGVNYRFFYNYNLDKMDYRQKMIIPSQQNTKNDDEDDEDLEALRLAALQSLRTKDTVHNKKQPPPQKTVSDVIQTSHTSYKSQRPLRRGYFHNRMQQRQNGNVYYQSPRNPNLIAIIPLDERPVLQQTDLACSVEKIVPSIESYSTEVTKFHRFKDNGSGSDEEDNKEQKNTVTKSENVKKDGVGDKISTMVENQMETVENLKKAEEDQGGVNDDDDDIIIMADLEEEDSLERLMDEMEREMNVDKPSERKEKKSNKKENRESMKKDEINRNISQKNRTEDSNIRKESYSPAPATIIIKSERRSISPHTVNRISQKRRSLSPRSRSRKKSPRRSPRRSPSRQSKKSQREMTRYRSPRKSPVRYSPRSRSPKLSSRSRSPRLSPRRSPNKSPMRSPIKRCLSPRGRSPKLSPHSRSPRPIRSPKISITKSPRLARSRSPRFSPLRLSPQSRSPLRSRSPKISPRRISPSRRLSPKSKSPGLSPRRGSSRLMSPKISPRRMSPRSRSPRLSPRRSPWSSPRNSPRLSPRRKRSPRWSPKELSRKHGPRSITPDGTCSPSYAKESSPIIKSRVSPEINRVKTKHKEESFEDATMIEKETADIINDPVLEARRRKFESTKPIDPINANKKIKLNKKENTSKKVESLEEGDIQTGNVRKVNKITEDYDIQETDLCLDTHYEFEEFEQSIENASPIAITSSVNSCLDLETQNPEKERSSKKKKKRDKELYQVGKLKNELPLSERIGKDKKCKKRKDVISDGSSEDMDAIFEDLVVDKESDLRTELSRRRAERLNRTVPIQSARLVQSAFKGVVNEVVKSNAKVNQRHLVKADEKTNQKEVRRVTVLHRSISDIHDSEDESTLDSKVPVRFRLGLNKQVQDTRESKVSRKTSKRQGRKVNHKINLAVTNAEHIL
ncbi:neurofilament heavy polypeptide isoform X1 [Bombus impatiens]|uniref:Neurofilament heavy polypeptide isoform X1 n=1 Tax=Bombus impatiens TaxID=132113 RepID=A0A6P3UWF7_BOMIM|nr:neurofilament heavy polypeptide isoform X1 [Bombus impatiens]